MNWKAFQFLLVLSLAFPTMSVAATRCLDQLAANIFPDLQSSPTGHVQTITSVGVILGVGEGIFVWNEKDLLFVASKTGILLATEQIPFEVRDMTVLPHLAASSNETNSIPMHLIGVIGANRLVVYQFDPDLNFDLRLAALDFSEPGYSPESVRAIMKALPNLPIEVPEFELLGPARERTQLLLRANRLRQVP